MVLKCFCINYIHCKIATDQYLVYLCLFSQFEYYVFNIVLDTNIGIWNTLEIKTNNELCLYCTYTQVFGKVQQS